MSQNKFLSFLNTMSEFPRAVVEIACGTAFNGAVGLLAPCGNKKPVLLIPGFMAPEMSLASLKNFLKLKNYEVYDWDKGINFGPEQISIEDVAQRIREISKQNNGQPVSIIGQSLGGVFAMGVAGILEKENIVERVITLGSPINGELLQSKDDVNKTLRIIYDYLNKPDHPNVDNFMKVMESALESGLPNTPITCVYSNYDGVVGAQAARTELSDPLKENVEVFLASHIGMGMDCRIRAVIADRLAVPIGQLKHHQAGLSPAL